MRSDDPSADRPPVSVGVGVDLFWGPDAGGHVKCWERFAEQAAVRPNDVDLTIYMLGESEKTIDIGGATRIQLLPPKRGTDRYKTTSGGGGGASHAVPVRACAPSSARCSWGGAEAVAAKQQRQQQQVPVGCFTPAA